jgi:glycosyltransferase involved in cell wall biosynthesis
MDSEDKSVLRIGFGGTLFRHRPGIDDQRPFSRRLKEWFWEYRPDFFIPTSRCGFYLFRGVARFKEKYPEMAGQLQVEIWGNIDPENQRQVNAMDIQDIVTIEGYRERAASRAKLDACDALFLPLELAKAGYKPLLIPGKVFEYLQAGKPVLTIGQDSDALDIMQRSGLGIVHDPEDADGIADSLRQLILDKEILGSKYVADATFVAQFDFRHLTKQLADVFEEVSRTK